MPDFMLNLGYFFPVINLPIDDGLSEQIHHKISQFHGFDSGT